jgi:hypothetical protein
MGVADLSASFAPAPGVPHRHQHHTDSCSRRAGVGRGGCGGAALCFLLSAVMAGGPGGGGCGALIVQTVLGGSMTPIPRPHTFQGGAKRARELSGGGPVKRSQPLSDTGGEEDDEVDMGRGGGGLSSARKGDIKVLPQRVRVLSGKAKIGSSVDEGKSVIYWMSRDQRVQDNWAFLYAQEVIAPQPDVPYVPGELEGVKGVECAAHCCIPAIQTRPLPFSCARLDSGPTTAQIHC